MARFRELLCILDGAFGKSGYSKLADNLMQNTKFLKDSLEEIGYDVIVEPELNIVAFNHPEKSPDQLSEELEKINGWKVSVANCPKAIRIVLMNHVTKTHLKEFLVDLEKLFFNSSSFINNEFIL